ncbi:MAG: hypothetical protein OWP43_10915 [Sphaerochaetaceae bacterium]|nr:hypothetical protein [Sphaerochaetaceae bacterium]
MNLQISPLSVESHTLFISQPISSALLYDANCPSTRALCPSVLAILNALAAIPTPI